MDPNAFWTGAAAAATVVAALVAVIAYVRGRTRVVVQVVRHEYAMPPAFRPLLKHLEDFRYSLPGYSAELKSADSGLRELLDRLTALAKDPAITGFTESWRSDTMWSFKVTNHGHERAEKLELQVPHAIQSLLVHSDGSQEAITGGIIHIPELRPGESVTILSWAGASGGDGPRLLQARGKATMRIQELVDSRWATVYWLWRDSPVLTLMLVLMLAVAIIAITGVVRLLLPA